MRWPRRLTAVQQVGQLLWIGFEGTTFTPPLARLLRDVQPGGIILFGRNLPHEARRLRALTDALVRAVAIPPFIALDQEGGRVSRLRGLLGPTLTGAALGARRDAPSAVRRHAEGTAMTLRTLGFNVNFAPVLDLSRAEADNGIGDRAYGDDPLTVSRLAGIFAATHTRAGVVPVGKHFPGLGPAVGDTHAVLPVVRTPRAALLRRDLLPYRKLRRALPMVMIGHACYPGIQDRDDQPASLSPAVVTDLLRGTLDYRGLVLTDDLEMGAIDQTLGAGALAVAAFRAGSDGLMFCKSEDRIRDAAATLLVAARDGRIPADRLRGSLRRIAALKRRALVARRRLRFTAGSLARAKAVLADLGPAPVFGPDPTART
ncbi:MAG TPA: glycoside hydrolase family 3 N-terminal domain-containing protein [Candidatus Polarisedimenticolia bacterium]|nr:glycoside hydrolase family 3 N-terminal domain-containing protein [Candidatus Polarisedimenticolia bacterium]